MREEKCLTRGDIEELQNVIFSVQFSHSTAFTYAALKFFVVSYKDRLDS